MKGALLMNIDSVIEDLSENEYQGVDVRGAIVAAKKFKSALSGISEGKLNFKVKVKEKEYLLKELIIKK